MKTVTLASIVSKVRSYADLTGNQFRTDAEIGTFVQARAEKLYEELVKAGGHHWALATSLISTSVGVGNYTLPTAVLQVVAVDLLHSGSDWVPLTETDFDGRYDYGSSYARPEAWFVAAQQLQMIPLPDAVYSVRLWYIPILGTLTDAGGTPVQLDSIHGWDEYVAWGVASDLRASQELDPSYQAARCNEEMARIKKMSRQRVPSARRLTRRRYAATARRTIYVR